MSPKRALHFLSSPCIFQPAPRPLYLHFLSSLYPSSCILLVFTHTIQPFYLFTIKDLIYKPKTPPFGPYIFSHHKEAVRLVVNLVFEVSLELKEVRLEEFKALKSRQAPRLVCILGFLGVRAFLIHFAVLIQRLV